MAQVNPLTREVLVKLVYYGPGLCGKTTSLQKIHAASPAETRGQIVSLATPVDRTLYFDFLPLRAQSVRGHHLRLQLFTVPGQVYFNATRKLVLTGADGVIFVADSQRDRMDANLESLENLAANLEDHQRALSNIPLVLQYNKRDLPSAVTVEEMDAALNALGVPTVCTNASKGEGVLESLDMLVRLVLDDLERRNVLGSVRPPPPEPPKFARAEPSLAQQVELASHELKLPDEPTKSSDSVPERTPLVSPASPASAPGPGPASVPPTRLDDEKTSDSDDILRPTVAPPSPVGAIRGLSFLSFFPEEAADLTALEAALAESRWAQVVEHAAALARRLLLGVGDELALPDGSRHPAVIATFVGVEGGRYRGFEKIVRRAETGGPIGERDAYAVFAFLIELKSRVDRLL